MLAAVLSLPAAELPFKPPAEFNCAISIAGKEVMKGRLYQGVGGLRRMEKDVHGEKSTIIIRPDRKQTIMLMESEKMAMTMPLDPRTQPVKDPSSDPAAVWSKAGTETLAGAECARYEWVSGSQKGMAWVELKRSVLVRVKDLVDGGQIDFTDYQIGAQKAEQFEVPAGYTTMGMPGVR